MINGKDQHTGTTVKDPDVIRRSRYQTRGSVEDSSSTFPPPRSDMICHLTPASPYPKFAPINHPADVLVAKTTVGFLPSLNESEISENRGRLGKTIAFARIFYTRRKRWDEGERVAILDLFAFVNKYHLRKCVVFALFICANKSAARYLCPGAKLTFRYGIIKGVRVKLVFRH